MMDWLQHAIAPEPLTGKRCLILGAGGAARAIAFGLKQEGCEVLIANRTYERGVALAEAVGAYPLRLSEILRVGAQIIINATSVGMHPRVDESPVPEGALKPGMVVFDTVYNPLETKLLREANEAGCRAVSGLEMFVLQAVEQFELWTQQAAPVEVMRRVTLRALGERS